MVTIEGNIITIGSIKATQDDKQNFELAVERLLTDGHDEIQVDLSTTIYIPSTLMGYLMWKKQQLKKKDINIKIIAISESLRKVFDEARISDFFELT